MRTQSHEPITLSQLVARSGGIILRSLGITDSNSIQAIEDSCIDASDKVFILALSSESMIGARGRNIGKGILEVLRDHVGVSFLHKPLMTLIFDDSHFYNSVLLSLHPELIDPEEITHGKARLHIVSDGKRAYIHILNGDSQ